MQVMRHSTTAVRPAVGAGRQLFFSIALVAVVGLALVAGGCAALPDLARSVKEYSPFKPATNDQILVDKAFNEIQGGNYAYAEVYLDAALQVNPSHSFALLNLGIVYEKTGRDEEARGIYTNLIRLAPTDIASRSGDDAAIGKTVTQLAEEQLAGLDRAMLALAVRGTEANEHVPDIDSDVDLESDWRGRVDERIALLEELKIQKFISDDEFIARVGGAWVLARMMPTPDTNGVVHRLTSLESYQRRGLLEADVFASERMVILDSVAPIRGVPVEGQVAAIEESKATAAAEAKTEAEMMGDDAEAKPIARADTQIHLASYRSEKAARKGWSDLKGRHKDLLGALDSHVNKIDLGPEKGIYYRLTAGPLGTSEAQTLCQQLLSRKHFCQISA